MSKRLADLQAGDHLEMPVLIEQMDVRKAKNGKQFLALTFADASGKIAGKYWQASDLDAKTFVAGQIVLLNGQCETYNNALQVKIDHLKLAPPNTYTLDQFVQHAPLTKQQLQDQMNELVLEITQPHWNRIVRYLINQHHEGFFEFPAAKKNHHDYTGGLAFHTLSIAKLANAVCDQYSQVNRALLIAGTILHDLGKTTELSGPVNTQYTVEGNLLGHLVIMDGEIVAACQQLKLDSNAEDVVLLRHMIIAHHGLLEYGSAKRPQLLEAEILHDLDELDATITMITKAQAKAQPGQFSERVFGLDNRRFYVPANLD
ncbi:HD domain-containing protein [Bombilactobacillus folatiphilus]|uniref:HD domain-containing protein n=1 Tax=Bombilactobacillus folatiphilus TaxID=2923362 RepID=A0ABY4PAC5_9LACO|nr:HD domain-containing protein [Bombilactobacillus folatiphilus]UQS82628.1 HD domain-containing protein [Bombilactobacillus folatiphilus]